MMARSDPDAGGTGRRVELPPKAIAAAVLALLGVVFIAQNREKRTIEFLFFDLEIGIWFGLAVTFVLGVVVGWLLRRARGQ